MESPGPEPGSIADWWLVIVSAITAVGGGITTALTMLWHRGRKAGEDDAQTKLHGDSLEDLAQRVAALETIGSQVALVKENARRIAALEEGQTIIRNFPTRDEFNGFRAEVASGFDRLTTRQDRMLEVMKHQ